MVMMMLLMKILSVLLVVNDDVISDDNFVNDVVGDEDVSLVSICCR